MISALLLPALLAFGFQWSLEVFHPLEEDAHAHAHEESAEYPLISRVECGQDAHGAHFCPHSQAFAAVPLLAAAFQVENSPAPSAPLIAHPMARLSFSIFERGPPLA